MFSWSDSVPHRTGIVIAKSRWLVGYLLNGVWCNGLWSRESRDQCLTIRVIPQWLTGQWESFVRSVKGCRMPKHPGFRVVLVLVLVPVWYQSGTLVHWSAQLEEQKKNILMSSVYVPKAFYSICCWFYVRIDLIVIIFNCIDILLKVLNENSF